MREELYERMGGGGGVGDVGGGYGEPPEEG